MPKQHRLLNELQAIEDQLNQLFEGSLPSGQHLRGSWSPAVDIYETAGNFVLTAEVPGVQSSQIDIKVAGHNLVLRGERRWERDAHGEHFHRLESAYGKFERTFSLSTQIDLDHISAELNHGVLTVILPKRSEKGRRQIEIEAD